MVRVPLGLQAYMLCHESVTLNHCETRLVVTFPGAAQPLFRQCKMLDPEKESHFRIIANSYLRL